MKFQSGDESLRTAYEALASAPKVVHRSPFRLWYGVSIRFARLPYNLCMQAFTLTTAPGECCEGLPLDMFLAPVCPKII